MTRVSERIPVSYGDPVGMRHTPEPQAAAAAFSSAVFRELGRENPAPFARERLALVANFALEKDATLGAAFDSALSILARDYRNEYVYKNGLVSKIVFGRHSPNTASALLELRMGNSWADLVVINGTTTTYEIKTDLDQFSRLESQTGDYESRSEFVVAVTSDKRAFRAEQLLPSHVGILALRKNGAISTVRAAESNLDRLRADHLFSMLRTGEAISILRDLRGYELDVASGEAWKRLRSLFSELTIAEAHRGVLGQLRLRATSAVNLTSNAAFPKSLRALAYSTELSAVGRRRLLQLMSAPAALVRDS